ncbi:MAG: hypothetical protein ABSE51_14320 [Terracidiphilus sp.]|jgi:hypothetical protein
MTRKLFGTTLAIAVLTALPLTPIFAQESTSTGSAAQTAALPNTALVFGKLEIAMSQANPDSKEFGQAVAEYWKLITASSDGGRAYNFFRALTAEQKTPNATLLAMRASADCNYIGWLVQANLVDSFGQPRIAQLEEQAHADFDEALKLDPQNFSALYGYAVYDGYRPGAQAHQKELLTRLDALRASRPYYPWQLVDTLEKNGKPQ